VVIQELDEFSEVPPKSFIATRCFVDATSGAFVQFEQLQFFDTACSGSPAEALNTSAPGCEARARGRLTRYACEESTSTPWEALPPAVTSL
jgi:hypothetical protein